MRELLHGHWRVLIMTGVAVGLAGAFFITDTNGRLNRQLASRPPRFVAAPRKPEPKPRLWEFPGGGRTLLPDYRLVALYGSFDSSSLGVLGQQPPEQSIAKIKEIAAQYQPFSDEPIYPAFELITTVASASATENGDYSRETSADKIRPIVELARRNGVYLVLDLQPGYNDFLSQAKLYEEFLREPHVGLALDPEWRLKPGQKHLRQIGSVSAAEINSVAAWLADLTKQHELPQKLLLLHQFKLSMITERGALDTSRPELAWSIQMDGLGNQNVKQDTWRAIRTGSPAKIHWGWKNFIDEDKPMLTPEQTMTAVSPRPLFISYQ